MHSHNLIIYFFYMERSYPNKVTLYNSQGRNSSYLNSLISFDIQIGFDSTKYTLLLHWLT